MVDLSRLALRSREIERKRLNLCHEIWLIRLELRLPVVLLDFHLLQILPKSPRLF